MLVLFLLLTHSFLVNHCTGEPRIDESYVITKLLCRWDGTAPFCEGSCKDHEMVFKKDKFGDGSKCFLGEKVKCCVLKNEVMNSDHSLQKKLSKHLKKMSGY